MRKCWVHYLCYQNYPNVNHEEQVWELLMRTCEWWPQLPVRRNKSSNYLLCVSKNDHWAFNVYIRKDIISGEMKLHVNSRQKVMSLMYCVQPDKICIKNFPSHWILAEINSSFLLLVFSLTFLCNDYSWTKILSSRPKHELRKAKTDNLPLLSVQHWTLGSLSGSQRELNWLKYHKAETNHAIHFPLSNLRHVSVLCVRQAKGVNTGPKLQELHLYTIQTPRSGKASHTHPSITRIHNW